MTKNLVHTIPQKNLAHAIDNEAVLTNRAEILADAWITHLYTTGKGTVEAYVNARADVVQMFYPEYDGRVPKRKAIRKPHGRPARPNPTRKKLAPLDTP